MPKRNNAIKSKIDPSTVIQRGKIEKKSKTCRSMAKCEKTDSGKAKTEKFVILGEFSSVKSQCW
jgi:hypothetical protein